MIVVEKNDQIILKSIIFDKKKTNWFIFYLMKIKCKSLTKILESYSQ